MKPRPLLALVLYAAAAMPADAWPQQKHATSQSAQAQQTQAQLEERIKQIEGRLAVAEQNAESSKLQDAYVKDVQTQANSYYDKVLTTQVMSLSILGLIITIVLAVAGRFSIKVFDDRARAALATTTTPVRV